MSELSEKVHVKVSIGQFKTIVRALGKVRYILDQGGNLHVGNAHNFIHSSIKREAGVPYDKDDERSGIVHGYAHYDSVRKELTHFVYYVYGEKGRYVDGDDLNEWTHPKLQELEARGVSRTLEQYEFVS